MKNSIKSSILFFALSGIVFGANAQTNAKKVPSGIVYSIGVESRLAAGNFNNSHRWNLGGSIQADFPVVKSLYLTANAGYNNFFGKDNIHDINLIPVKGGIKYFPLDILYVQGEAGAAFSTNKSTVGFDNSAAFIYAPQVGVRIQLGNSNSFIDAGVRYEGSSKFATKAESSKVNFFGLRVAYALTSR
ncbi:hypothetical protein GCM10023149_15900 [Mucilaginibacter gynuensis]|uniref:Outer membrane protein beta-barrel domain-containing protein n=1 Tax=Mucilaginibacter gynuensis TaxID=1302236 RepID=A0ABP8G6H2_9SPHI